MKKYIFTFIFVYIITNSLLFPRIALESTGEGIYTWFHQILPSLLPFTILSGIFLRSKWMDSVVFSGSPAADKKHTLLQKRKSLLPISIILLCGTVFGFPIGAKLSSDFYKQGYIQKSQAEILSVCTNNFSPMYVNGFVIPLLFGINAIIFPILFLLYAIPVLVGIVLLVFTNKESATDVIMQDNYSQQALSRTTPHTNVHQTITSTCLTAQKKSASRFQLDMQIIDAGIISGFETLIRICGYIVLFSLITSFLTLFVKNLSLPGLCLLGNLEISNGMKLLSEFQISNEIKYIIAIQFLSFGGISGLVQSASFLTSSQLSVKKYLLGKILLSCILTAFAALLPIILPNQH